MPSRGRPQRAYEAIQALRRAAVRVDTSVVLAVDADDPECNAYHDLTFGGTGPEVTRVTLMSADTGNLVKATNTVSLRIAADDPDAIIGNLGDDHVVRTFGWDRMIIEALDRPGIAYGDDLIHGEHLPSAPFISATIVNALGWYALPTCRHLYIDDAWRELGKATRTLRYLPELVIEHMHPALKKADWDEGYERANNAETVEHDKDAYRTWRSHWMNADMRNVLNALNVWAGKRMNYASRSE